MIDEEHRTATKFDINRFALSPNSIEKSRKSIRIVKTPTRIQVPNCLCRCFNLIRVSLAKTP